MSILIAVVKFLFALTLCDATIPKHCTQILAGLKSWNFTSNDNLYFSYHWTGLKFVCEEPIIFGPVKMTMKQVKSTGKMMRKTCQPKNNVADEKIDPMAKGVFIEEREVMCYVACIMKMANAVKNNKLDFPAALKQADLLLPDEIKQPAKDAITACKKVADPYKDDICEASFFVTKCIYNHNPAVFFFP